MSIEQEIVPTSQLTFSPEAQEVLRIALFDSGSEVDTSNLLAGLTQVGKLGERLREIGVTAEKVLQASERFYPGTRKVLKINREINRLLGDLVYPTETIEQWKHSPVTQPMRRIAAVITQNVIREKRDVIESYDIFVAIVTDGQNFGAMILNELGVGRYVVGEKDELIGLEGTST